MKHIYTGVFFDRAELNDLFARHIGKAKLSNIVENPHVTFTSKPTEVMSGLFGTHIRFDVIGYACDGVNQGLRVKISDHMQWGKGCLPLLSEYYRLKNPHITISVSEDGRPVDTGNLEFEPLSEPFEIVGDYGIFTDEGILFECPNELTVAEFCLHATQPLELCAICDGGWVVGTVWIDREDIFTIPKCLKNKIVKSDYWGELPIVNEKGESMRIPAHFIDT